MRKADNLPPSCAVVTKSGSLNLLEPSGPVQACNGTALPFTFYRASILTTVTIANSNNAFPDDGVTVPKHDGAILM